MEKVLYVVWRNPDDSRADFGSRLRMDVAEALIERGARGVQVNVEDDDVAPAERIRFVHADPYPAGLVSVWVDSAITSRRGPFDAAVADGVAGFAAYLVAESEPIVNTRFPAEPGARTEGMAQVAFLTRAPHLDPDQWRAIWHDSHTDIAIATQDTFAYVQNEIIRALTPDAPGYHAIVEELYPAAAMTDPHAFYDAVGDEDRYRHNFRTVVESAARFTDLDRIDVVPTSRYVIRAVG